MQILALARHFVKQLEKGDVDGAKACLSAEAEIWHDFDNKTQTVEENMALFSWLISHTQKREYEITRLEEIKDGYLQQHTLRLTTLTGEAVTAFACCLVKVTDGKITRIEEYINSAALAVLSE